MKFTCEKAILENAINTAARVVPSQTTIPPLKGLLLDCQDGALSITGYDLKTGIRTKIPVSILDQEEGSTVLDAKLLTSIVRQLPDDIVLVKTSELGQPMAQITCGAVEYSIQTMNAADYPDMPKLDGNENRITLQQKQLQSLIQNTSFAISVKENRPIYTGALFDIQGQAITVATVDGFRMAVRRESLSEPSPDFSFITPGAALSNLEKICAPMETPVTITQGKTSTLFQLNNTELICQKLEGTFIDYKTTIPHDNPIRVTANVKDLCTCIDRAAVIITDKQKTPLRCLFGNNQVTITAQSQEGTSCDVCAMEGDGHNLEIGFNNTYLMDALRHASTEKVIIALNKAISPAVITPPDDSDLYEYMILPVRLKSAYNG